MLPCDQRLLCRAGLSCGDSSGLWPQNPVCEDRVSPPLIQGTKFAPGIFLGAGDAAAKEGTRNFPIPGTFPTGSAPSGCDPSPHPAVTAS